jgi:hypothetical protein
MPVQGERIAGFILITGIDGIRYAVRQNAISVISDHDEAQDETCVLLHGGETWDDIFYRNAVKRMRADGLNRQRAKVAAKQYVTEWRKFGRVRVGRLY